MVRATVEPLISAIMPARGRPELAAAAVACWRRQTWPNKELVIVDDADCPAFPDPLLMAAQEHVLYARNSQRLTIGEKRNQACEMARGEYIAHFDSDDYSAPGRLQEQLEQLGGKAVTGYHHLLFTDGRSWWRYDGPQFVAGYAAMGTSFFFRKSWWEKHRFVAGPTFKKLDSEDNPFVREAMMLRTFVGFNAREMMFARIHEDNTAAKCTTGVRWKPVTDAVEIKRYEGLTL